MSTLAELRDHVSWRLGARTDLTSGSGLVQLDHWINSAYREITHTIRFSELESVDTSLTTSPTSRFVDLSLIPRFYALLSVFDVTNDNALTLYPGDFEAYERFVGTQTGQPTEFLRFAELLNFSPPPSGAFALRLGLWLDPLPLTVMGATPVIPDVWHDAIEILATRNGYRAVDDAERADSIVRGEYRQFLGSVRSPRAIESHRTKRRGVRSRMFIRDRRVGI